MSGPVAFDLVVRARRAVTPDGERSCAVGVSGGRIAAVEAYDAPLVAARTVDVDDDAVLLPGLVDTHVHVNEPGRTEWEGFASATRAAAAGGITSILDMPLNSIPPTVDVPSLQAKRSAAEGAVHVDVGFWGGAVPGNLDELAGLHEAGVFGFKCFLLDSGVPEFPHLERAQLVEHLGVIAELGALLIVHAEDQATIDQATSDLATSDQATSGGPAAPDARAYETFLASRPPEAEEVAIARVIDAARVTGARVHIVHLSNAGALPMIRAARAGGVRLTVETCPHYLVLAAEEVPDGATEFKCCPPIRGAENRDALWAGLAAGLIDIVVSDHSPCTPELKRLDEGDFGAAWGGIAGLQLTLPAVWTEARRRGHSLSEVVDWMAARPAALGGLGRKGRLAVGCDADLAVFAPDEAFVVDPARLYHRSPITPYAGRRLVGVVRRTWLRGAEVTGDLPRGRLLTRQGA